MRTKDHILIENAYKSIQEMAYGIAGSPAEQRTITQEQLVELIKQAEQNHPGTNFIGVTQVTKETTKKPTDEYIPFVLPGLKGGKTYFAKVTQVNGEIGSNYTTKRNRELENQGKPADFVAQPSKYSTVENSISLKELEGQLYIQYFPRSISKDRVPVLVKAQKPNPTNSEDFVIATTEEVNQFKGAPPPPQPVIIRVVSVSSIAAIRINKQEYVVSDLDPIRKAIWVVSGMPMPPEDPEAQ